MKSKYLPYEVSKVNALKGLVKRICFSHARFFAGSLESRVKALFIIGCGHSGTSLVSAKLGNLSESLLVGRESAAFLPFNSIEVSRAILSEWLHFAEFAGKSFLLEKTPKHVHCIKRIQKLKPDALFLGMVRNPLDNCASLYRRYNDLDFAIYRWNVDNRALCRAYEICGDASMKIMSYESLASSPMDSLKNLSASFGIPWEEECLSVVGSAYSQSSQLGGKAVPKNLVIRAKQVDEPIVPKVGTWKKILSQQQKEEVLVKTRFVHSMLSRYCDVDVPI